MRIFHYIEIENFKGFGEKQRIELDHPAVLIGPNNSGKTTAIQSLGVVVLRCQRLSSSAAGLRSHDSTRCSVEPPSHRRCPSGTNAPLLARHALG
jgi:AAA15 family ATPase/GTPase